MTPDQAAKAADILSLHAARNGSEDLAATLAAVEHLRRLAAQQSDCWWKFASGTLQAFDPSLGRDVFLRRVSAFAQVAPIAWQSPGKAVPVEHSNRQAAKSQRHALARRLEQVHMHTLAQAVRDIRLCQQGDTLLATYEPQDTPINLSLP